MPTVAVAVAVAVAVVVGVVGVSYRNNCVDAVRHLLVHEKRMMP